MKEQLGNFTIQDQIDEGGDTVVYRATEDMGQGITRPAAVKVLSGIKGDDEERIETLKREVGMLVEVSASPNIVTVYGFGIDEEEGPWIAMELLGKSLRHFITEKPADPEQVRVLLRDALRGMSVVHSSQPPILHRDIKPNNILSTRFNNWQITDFGLAKRANTDDTLQVMTVKYASPEMLDGQLGEEAPTMDLYSLGMVVYEYALGTELHKQQFPSVYDPQGGDGGDERPKWMYWHTSMQMTVPPLSEVIEDYPQDLSDLVAAMTAKPIRERIESAGKALEMLGSDQGAVVRRIEEELEPDDSKAKAKRNMLIGMVAALVIILAAAGYFVMQEVANTPEIQFAQAEKYVATSGTVQVTGTIANFPEGGSAQIRLEDNSTCPVYVDSSGKFNSEVRVNKLGDANAMMTVFDGFNFEVATGLLELSRVPPKTVRVVINTRPSTANASIVLTERDNPDQTKNLKTDTNGSASADIAYGGFDLEISHPKFVREKNYFETDINEVKNLTFRLKSLSEERLDDKRADLLTDMDSIVDEAAAGNQDAIDKLADLRADLKNLTPTSQEADSDKKIPLFEELDEVSGLAAIGDAEAASRVHGIKNEFQDIRAGGPETVTAPVEPRIIRVAGGNVDPNSPQGRRQALLAEMNSLADAAAAGDPQAIARMQQIQGDLAALSEAELAANPDARRAALVRDLENLTERAAAGDEVALSRMAEVSDKLAEMNVASGAPVGNPERAALVAEMEGLAERAAAGDPDAIARIKEIQGELQQMDAVARGADSRRDELLSEMDSLAARAAAGDPTAIARIKQIQQELGQIDARESALSSADARRGKRAALVSEMEELAERAAAGDPEAIARLAEVQQELAALDAADAGDAGDPKASKRAALVAEMEDLAARAAAGDPEAAARLRQVRTELAALDGKDAVRTQRKSTAARRSALLSEMDSLAAAAAAGDPAAIARMQEIQAELGELNAAELAASGAAAPSVERAALLQEMDSLKERAAAGDPAAIARMQEIQQELAALDARETKSALAGGASSRRNSLVREMESLAERAAAGDPAAIARMQEIQEELKRIDAGEAVTSGAAARETKRAALVAEMAELSRKAAAGDPEAIARLAEVQQELAALDAEDAANSAPAAGATRRAALVAEMESLTARAAAGDPAAIARLAEIQKELKEIDATAAATSAPAARESRRAALVQEMADLQARVAAGDPAAIARMQEIQQELAQIEAKDAATTAPAMGESRRAALIAEMADLAERAAAGDPKAIARLAEVQKELEGIVGADAAAASPQALAARRSALEQEAADLEARAAAGDPAAIARLAEIQQELGQVEAQEKAAARDARRAELVAEMADLQARAAAGDPAAIARLQEIQQELTRLDVEEKADSVASRRSALVQEMADLQERAANGDPAAIARLAEIQQELTQLDAEAKANSVAGRRAALVDEMADLQERVAAGDPAAIARMQEIQQELAQLEEQEQAESVAARRSALVDEMADLQARVAAGDPAAIARMKEIQEELAQLEEEEKAGSVASRRAALVKEMKDLEARAAAGDPAAIARLAEIQGELAQLDAEEEAGSVASRRAALVEEMKDLEARAAAGDPAAIARLAEIQGELAQLDQEEKSESVAARRSDLVDEMADLQERIAAGDPAAIARMKEIQEELAQLDEEEKANSTSARRAALVEEMESLQERAAAGDPVAIARLQEIQKELGELAAEEKAGSIAGRREALVEEMGDLADQAAQGNTAAAERLKDVQKDLASLEEEEAGNTEEGQRSDLLEEMNAALQRASGTAQAWQTAAAAASMRQVYERLKDLESNDSYNSDAARRAALIHEMEDLMARAAAGDPEAIARLREIQKELAMLEGGDASQQAPAAGGLPADRVARRAALIKELGVVGERAQAGDRAALGRVAEIQKELERIEANEADGSALVRRRKQLVGELGVVTDLAFSGDSDSLLRILGIQRELAALSLIESASDGSMLASAQSLLQEEQMSLDLIDRTTLLQLSPQEFKVFVELNIPVGTLTVETVPHVSKLRVMGPVFNDNELTMLRERLRPAESRIRYELRTDPWAVCRMIQDMLERRGAQGVRVHAHLTSGDNAIFVQMKKSRLWTRDKAYAIVRPYVIDPLLLFIQPYTKELEPSSTGASGQE